jgi:hypothetical protein
MTALLLLFLFVLALAFNHGAHRNDPELEAFGEKGRLQ